MLIIKVFFSAKYDSLSCRPLPSLLIHSFIAGPTLHVHSFINCRPLPLRSFIDCYWELVLYIACVDRCVESSVFSIYQTIPQESACQFQINQLLKCCKKLNPDILKHSVYCEGVIKKGY